jgi:CheY-like chemotaxis protein
MIKTPYAVIVEDDAWQAELFVRTLADAGVRASTVASAMAAIETIDAAVPDVIVLDVFLAGANAFTLLHELQSHADLASIPVIVCTNSANQLPGDMAAYGVCVILDKVTMQPGDLVAAVKKAIL